MTMNRYTVSVTGFFLADDSEHAVEQFIDMVSESLVAPNNVEMVCLTCNHTVGEHENTDAAQCRMCECDALHINIGECINQCFTQAEAEL